MTTSCLGQYSAIFVFFSHVPFNLYKSQQQRADTGFLPLPLSEWGKISGKGVALEW